MQKNPEYTKRLINRIHAFKKHGNLVVASVYVFPKYVRALGIYII